MIFLNTEFVFVNVKYKWNIELIRKIIALGGKVKIVRVDLESDSLDDSISCNASLISNNLSTFSAFQKFESIKVFDS